MTAGLKVRLRSQRKAILPKAIRDRLHLDVGIRLAVEHTAEGVLLKPLTTVLVPTRPENVFGCLTQARRSRWNRWMRGLPQKPDGGMRAMGANIIVRYLTGDDPEQGGERPCLNRPRAGLRAANGAAGGRASATRRL